MEELEIEFKNMIDYPLFAHFKETLFRDAVKITQTNFYIDTADYQIISSKMALRIRDTGQSLMMTLKIPQDIGVMEYHGVINPELLDSEVIEYKDLPENIKAQLADRHLLDTPLLIIGALSTERREIPYKDGLLVLDASHYIDQEDYELEYEVSDYEAGLASFKRLLDEYNIPFQPSRNKIQRFFDRHIALTSKKL